MSEEPLYNIGVVTRVTGIPITTLHAWERRYGFPRAARSAGGHRLYSDRDIARLRWVKTRVDAGMAVSRAVAAAQSLETDGIAFPASMPEAVQLSGQGQSAASPLDALHQALIQHDLPGADRLMGEMLAFHSPEDLTVEVISPALARLGEAWEKGEISIATEHLASNYLRHRLLMWMVTGPNPNRPDPIILACAPGEWHEGSLLMLGVLLRRRGYPVAYLGQDVPFHSLAEISRAIQSPAILLVAMRAETAAALADWTRWIPQVGGKPLVVFGGRAFTVNPALQQTVPGHYLGDSILQGVERLEALLGK